MTKHKSTCTFNPLSRVRADRHSKGPFLRQHVGERGRFHKARCEGYTTVVTHPDGTREITHYRPVPGGVVLDQDVRAYFPDSAAVNTALRGLMALIPAKRRTARKRRHPAHD